MNRMSEAARIAAAFHHQADEYDQHTLVQKRVVAQLAASVGLHLQRVPEHILDVGTGTGGLLVKLHERYPHAALTGVDAALNMCLRTQQKLGSACSVVHGDAECLPLENGMFDLVVSASALQWVGDLSAALQEMRRVVRSGGDISLAFFCDGTLAELHHCMRDAAGLCSGDSSHVLSRLHRFRSVDEVKALVNSMDFERAVMTVETEVDWYDDLHSLLRSIRNIGAGAVSGGSVHGLGWRGILQNASRLYRERYGREGRIPATYKVLYLSARVAG